MSLHSTARSLTATGGMELLRIAQSVEDDGVLDTARQELATEREYVSGADSTASTMLRAGQSGGQLVAVMITIVIAAAVGFVGTTVIASLEDSVTDENVSEIDPENRTIYENTTHEIGGGFADAMSLTDVVFLVLMASVVLGALLAFRGAR
ncbi:MAG: hypothetical protein ACOCQY_05040 [Halorhabdus sp.]